MDSEIENEICDEFVFVEAGKHTTHDGTSVDGEMNDTPLHLACRDGKIDVARVLLQQDCNARVDGKNKDGDTPLQLACKRGDVDLVKFLLQHDSTKVDGDTPLHVACRRGDVDVVELLLQHDSAEINCGNKDGDTPLCIACSIGKADLVELLLRHQSSAYVNCAMPLEIACRLRNVDIIRSLLRHDHNMTQCDGDTPLHIACRNGAVGVVKALLQHDPSSTLDALNSSRETPLSIASKPDSIAIMNTICHNPRSGYYKETSLHKACRSGNVGSSILTALVMCDPTKALDRNIFGDTPLHVACRHSKKADLVKALLQHSPSVQISGRNLYGNTPLHFACINGKADIVKLLLEYDSHATTTVKNKDGNTPFHIACRQGKADIVKALLWHDPSSATANIKNNEGSTVLYLACKYGTADMVKALLHHYSSEQVNVKVHGDVPLHVACRRGQVDIVEALLQHDSSSVHTSNWDNNAPLHIACMYGATGIVKLLLEHYPFATANVENKDGDTPLHIASRRGQVDIVETLILHHDPNTIHSSDESLLHLACRIGQIDVIRILLQHFDGAKVNDKNYYGDTPLHLACRMGVIDIVKALLQYRRDAEIDGTDNNGDTPLHIACRKGEIDIVQALLQHCGEAEIDGINIDGDTPLHIACRKGEIDIALLQYCGSAITDDTNNDGDTPLHLACRMGEIDIVRHLLQYCVAAKIDKKDGHGNTSLHLACRKGYVDVAKALLQYCDDKSRHGDTPLYTPPSATGVVTTLLECDSTNGDSPLHVACRYNEKADLVNVLLQYNPSVQVSSRNWHGNTPLHLACIEGKTVIVKRLLEYDPGATANVKNYAGYTVLHLACTHGTADMVKIVLHHYPSEQVNVKVYNGDIPLHQACRLGKVDIVEALLQHDPSTIHTSSKDNDTSLHIACRIGKVDIVTALLHYCDCSIIDKKNRYGDTSLHLACRKGEVDIVKALLQYCDGTKIDAKNWFGDTPLHLACWHNKVDLVETLLMVDPTKVDIKNDIGDTLLHIACRHDVADVINTLLQHCSTQLEVKNLNGDTPLHLACCHNEVNIVETLLMHDPTRVDIKNDAGDTLLHTTSRHDILKSLCNAQLDVKNSNGDTPLHLACCHNQVNIVETLLMHDPSRIDIKNDVGDTLLHVACRHGAADTVKALLQHSKAQLDAKNHDSMTPLHLACRTGEVGMVKVLLQYDSSDKMNNNIWTCASITALEIASKFDKIDIIRALIEHYSISQNDGDTLLHAACRNGAAGVVKTVLQYNLAGADVDALNDTDETPSAIACKLGSIDVINNILLHDPRATKRDSDSPLHIACREGKVDMIKAILQHDPDASVDFKNKEGDAPIHIACRNGEVGIVGILMQHDPTAIHVRTENGDTLLHLACRHASSSKMLIKLLVSECGFSVSLVNNQGNTPLHVATKESNFDAIVALLDFKSSIYVGNKEGKTPVNLISRPSIQSLYDSHISRYSREIDSEYISMTKLATRRYAKAQCITRLFVVGHPGAGKSSLVETLKREGFFQSTFTRVSDKFVPLHTAGIVPTVHTSHKLGRVQFYDFAGDPEYYSSHAAILERLFLSNVGRNVFILVLNLNRSESDIVKEYTYWSNFISHNTRNLQRTPSVLAIGSHIDQLSSSDIKEQKKSHFQKLFSGSRHFFLDCCNPGSSGIRKLRQAIQAIARKSQPYKLSYEASLLLGLLEKDFNNVTACTAKTLLSHVQDLNLLRLPRSLSGLYHLLQQLQAIGTLLILGGKEDDSYLVLNISELTNEVHKRLFSEDADSSLATFKIGLLPPSLLEDEILPKYITKDCLIQLQYCQEIPFIDFYLNHDCKGSLQITSQEDYILFFPALCKVDKKDISWQCGESDFSISWVARCTDSRDYFPSRFLHVLLLRIVFSSSLCVPQHDSSPDQHGHLKRRCKMWKTGVHWQTEEGVECEVHVDISKEVVVSVRCERSNLKRCFALFNGIIGYVMEAQREFCNSNKLSFHLLDSETNLYLLENVKACLDERKHSVVDITGERRMPLSDLQHIGTTFWNTLFSIDVDSVIKHLQPLVAQWFQLGTHLKFPHSALTAIEIDHYSSVMKQKVVMVEQWIDPLHSPSTDPPCWWSLVNALEEIDENTCVETIKQEHGDAINIQKRLLESECHCMQPDDEFLHSLSGVLESKWPHLAVLLGLSGADIQAVRKEGKGKSWKKQALLMLGKWVGKGGATYGQLFEKLKPISLFELCQ